MLPVALIKILEEQNKEIKFLREKMELLKCLVLELSEHHKGEGELKTHLKAFFDINEDIEKEKEND